MSKWEGKISAQVGNTEAEQVWPLLADFCNFHKWFPMDTCRQVDGEAGVIRYCEGTLRDEGEERRVWAKEKLLVLDPIQRYVTYEVVDNNMGFKSYVATMKVLPKLKDEEGGCKIEWSFVCDLVEGWTYEALLSYFHSSLNYMVNKMEQAFSLTH
ncbi:lachrymatory-factor synthase-like [Senna tora]|uniref:Lachrymatory-factor synthase-like n=1 Tax=Senna tora TaxID=362788 RepID=A0A834WRU2_9FABA|nr:lachrymatory-factor synthase-like [Senna tora]